MTSPSRHRFGGVAAELLGLACVVIGGILLTSLAATSPYAEGGRVAVAAGLLLVGVALVQLAARGRRGDA